MKERKKEVIIFFNNFRYKGTLISEDDNTYTIDDTKEGIIRLPKNNSILKEVEVK